MLVTHMTQNGSLSLCDFGSKAGFLDKKNDKIHKVKIFRLQQQKNSANFKITKTATEKY